MRKNLVLLMSSILLGSAMLVPVSVSAESLGNNDVQENSKVQQVVQSADLSYYENSPYFDVQKSNVTGDTEITFIDADLVHLLNASGIGTTGFNIIACANGVNKIVWHGQARYGNVDIYLSKYTLNGMYALGIDEIVATITWCGYSYCWGCYRTNCKSWINL